MRRGLTLLEVLFASVMLTGLMIAGLMMLTSLSGTREARDAAAWERSARASLSEIQRALDRRFGEDLPLRPVVLTSDGLRSYRSERAFDEIELRSGVLFINSENQARVLIGEVSEFVCRIDEHRTIVEVKLSGQCGRSLTRTLPLGSAK